MRIDDMPTQKAFVVEKEVTGSMSLSTVVLSLIEQDAFGVCC